VIKTSLGGMGRSVEDIELIHRVLYDASPKVAETSGTVPLPYRKVELPEKLKIGYYLTGAFIFFLFFSTLMLTLLSPNTDGFCRASPACERAVLETVAALRKQGHELIEFSPPSRSSVPFFILSSGVLTRSCLQRSLRWSFLWH
jgi:Asp-tRNA(Asn)/Glu-tRNA(Gln) amidotransferase A subunit family amidase